MGLEMIAVQHLGKLIQVLTCDSWCAVNNWKTEMNKALLSSYLAVVAKLTADIQKYNYIFGRVCIWAGRRAQADSVSICSRVGVFPVLHSHFWQVQPHVFRSFLHFTRSISLFSPFCLLRRQHAIPRLSLVASRSHWPFRQLPLPRLTALQAEACSQNPLQWSKTPNIPNSTPPPKQRASVTRNIDRNADIFPHMSIVFQKICSLGKWLSRKMFLFYYVKCKVVNTAAPQLAINLPTLK